MDLGELFYVDLVWITKDFWQIAKDSEFLNASKYCGSVPKNNFVVVVVDELLSNF